MNKILYTICLSLLALNLFANKLTVNVTTAGGLSAAITAAGGNATLIDSLTVNGNIDARDVKYMRDDMTVLAVLDLGGVSIMAYIGSEGTSSVTSYPADEMPEFSFWFKFVSKKTLKSITFPSGIKSIGAVAFSDCSGLTGSLIIPNSVSSIGRSAFSGCSGLTGSLSIPNSVTSIRDHAFANCSGFTGNLIIPNSVTSIGYAAFMYCSGFTGNLIIPNSVTSIDQFAFEGCTGLTGRLSISDSIISIGTGAFGHCYRLTGNLTIPSSVTSISSYAFDGCSGFTGSLSIPNSVISIDENAFSNCSGLTGSLTIPNSVTSIGKNTFSDCFRIKKIIVSIVTPLKIDSSFKNPFYSNNIDSCVLIVPMGSKAAYQNTSGWKDFKNIQERTMVIYKLNGGIGTNASDSIIEINALIKEPTNPVKKNYNFSGWYSDSTFTTKWDFSLNKIKDNVVLYAKWDIKLNPVYFMLDSISVFLKTYCKTDSLIKLPKNPEKTGCSFAGWYKDTTLINAWNFNSTKVNDTVFLYVKWQCIVKFYSYGKEVMLGDWVNYNSLVNIRPSTIGLGKGDDIFGGWYTEPEFINKWNFITDRVTKNTNLYAKWTNTSQLENKNFTFFSLYPNPATNILNIQGQNLKQAKVFNLAGKELMRVVLNNSNQTELNVSGLLSGYYIIRITDNKGMEEAMSFVKK